MSSSSVSAAATVLSLFFLAASLPAEDAAHAPQNAGSSKVRIVRLSEVRGEVKLDRPATGGSDPAIANLPIVEQSRLLTVAGIAEVEFEDNSTLRLAPYSVVEFPQLERLANGHTLSEVRLLKGTAYVSLLKTPGNQFTIDFGQQKLQLGPASHIRLEIDESGAKLAVLDGEVQLGEPGSLIDVPRKRTITFPSQDGSKPEIAKEVEPGNFDAWDKQSSQYHARAASFSALGSAPYAYGASDLMYYGSFSDMGGCGTMWRPYFASAGWSPYANGTWAWYQSAGYSWVSPYPWGWMPYHYGSWSFCPGAGWGWMPGGGWTGLNNMAAVGSGATTTVLQPIPHPPAHPPRLGSPGLVPINLKPLVESKMGSDNAFVFRRDSAGLGVPREGLGKLNGFSRGAVRTGSVSTPVFLTAGSSASGEGRTHPGGTLAPIMVHRGDAASSALPTLSGQGNAGRSSQGPSLGSGGPGSRSPNPSGGVHPSGGSAAPASGGGGFGGGHMGGSSGGGGGVHPSGGNAGGGTHGH